MDTQRILNGIAERLQNGETVPINPGKLEMVVRNMEDRGIEVEICNTPRLTIKEKCQDH